MNNETIRKTAEENCIQALGKIEVKAERTDHNAPYNLNAEGVRIRIRSVTNIKVVKGKKEDGHYAQFENSKKQKNNPDEEEFEFIILCWLGNEQYPKARYWIIPSHQANQSMRMRLNASQRQGSQWDQYENAWKLIAKSPLRGKNDHHRLYSTSGYFATDEHKARFGEVGAENSKTRREHALRNIFTAHQTLLSETGKEPTMTAIAEKAGTTISTVSRYYQMIRLGTLDLNELDLENLIPQSVKDSIPERE